MVLNKRISALLFLAFLTACLVFSGCGGSSKKRNPINYYESLEGKIIQIPLADRLLVKTDAGVTRVVVLNEDTEIKKDGDDAKFKDLKENDTIKIKGNTDPENNVFIAGSIESGEKVRPGNSISPGSIPTGGGFGH